MFIQRLLDRGGGGGETKKIMAVEPTSDHDVETTTTPPSSVTVKKKVTKKKVKDVEQPVSESSLEISTGSRTKQMKRSGSKNGSSQSIQNSDDGSLPSVSSAKATPNVKSKKSKDPNTPMKEKKESVQSSELDIVTPKAGSKGGNASKGDAGESNTTKKTNSKGKAITPSQTPESTPLSTKKKLALLHDSSSTLLTTGSDGNSAKRESIWKTIVHDDVFMSPKKEAKMKALAAARGDSTSSLGKTTEDPIVKSPGRKDKKVKDAAAAEETAKSLSPKRQGSKVKTPKVPTSKTTSSSSTTAPKEKLTSKSADSSIRLPEIPDLVAEASPAKNRRPRPSNTMGKLASSDTSGSTTTMSASLAGLPRSRSTSSVTESPGLESEEEFLKVQLAASPRLSRTKALSTPKSSSSTTKAQGAAAPKRTLSKSPRRRQASEGQLQAKDTRPTEGGADSKKRNKSNERSSSLNNIPSHDDPVSEPAPVREPQRKLSKSKKKAANKDSDVVNPPRILKTTKAAENGASGTPLESGNADSAQAPPSSDRQDKKAAKVQKESRPTPEEDTPPNPTLDEKKVKKSTGKRAPENEPGQDSQPQRKISKSPKRVKNKDTNGEPTSTPRHASSKEKVVKPENFSAALPLDSDTPTIQEMPAEREDKKESRDAARAQKEARRTAERTTSPLPDQSQGDNVEDKKGKKSKAKPSAITTTTAKAKDDEKEPELDSQERTEVPPQGKGSKSRKKSKDTGAVTSLPSENGKEEVPASGTESMASRLGRDASTGPLAESHTNDDEGRKKSRDAVKARSKSPRRDESATTPLPEPSQVDGQQDDKEKKPGSKGKQAISIAEDNEKEQVLDAHSLLEIQPQEKVTKSKKKPQVKEAVARPEIIASGSPTDSDMVTLEHEKSSSNEENEIKSRNAQQTEKEARHLAESTSLGREEVSPVGSTDQNEKKSRAKQQASKARDNEKEKIIDSEVETQPQKQSQTNNADDGKDSLLPSQNNDTTLIISDMLKQPLHADTDDAACKEKMPYSRDTLKAQKDDCRATESVTARVQDVSQNENVTEQPSNKTTVRIEERNRIGTGSNPELPPQEEVKESINLGKAQKDGSEKDNDAAKLSQGSARGNQLTTLSETTIGSQTDVKISAANANPTDRNDAKTMKTQEDHDQGTESIIAPSPDATTSPRADSKFDPVESHSMTTEDQNKRAKEEEPSSSEGPWYAKQFFNGGDRGQARFEQERSSSISSLSAPISSRSNTPSPKSPEKSSILGRVRPQLSRADTGSARSNTPSPKLGGKPGVGSRQRQSFMGYGTPRASPKPNGTEGPSPKTPLHSEANDRFDIVGMTPPFRESITTDDLMPFITPKRTSTIRNDSQFASSKSALIDALTTPVRKQREALASIDRTPRTLKRGFVEMNQKATRTSGAKTPGLRVMDSSHHGKDKARTYIDAALDMLDNDEKVDEVENLVRKIESLGGFPKTRRLSLRDNELVGQLVLAVRNDPRITAVHVDAAMFGTISSTLLSQFIDSLRINLHVKSLSFQGLELGNAFLYDLVASMEYNFVVEDIDLSENCFTSEGLATFCQALALTNESVKRVNLKNQTTPISEASQVDVLEALEQNKTLTTIELDFVCDDGPEKLEKIMERNRVLGPQQTMNAGEKLINVLNFEAEKAQEVWEQQQAELEVIDEEECDWDYYYELALLFDKHKLKKEVEENAMDFSGPPKRENADDLSAEEKKKFLFGEFKKNMEDSVMAFNEDGSFLTPDFIAKFFKERPEEGALDFDFHGQWKLFRRFPVHDPARQTIVDKFIDAIVTHPRANDLTGINMANTGAGDDFLIALSKRCLADSSLLPNLHTVNFETNFINEPGVVALADLVASPTSCKYMQVIRLENQKGLLKSKAEFALAKAMRVNRSIVVISLTVRNLLERERIGKYIMRNVDLIRQARQEYMKARGLQRKRNKVERVFDSVKENNKDLVKIDMKGNERFLTLTKEERIKAAQAFAHNTHVKELLLDGCGIDDVFAQALGEALVTNTAIQKVSMEGNDISGEGIKALFKGLGKNHGIKELRLHKQSKLLATSDEELLPDFLEENTTITKIGIDLRSKMAQIKLDQKTRQNISLELKEKAAAKGEESGEAETVYLIRF